MRKLFFIFLLIFSFFFASSRRVSADGMILPPPGYWIEETEQKAVIFHEGSQETLILSVAFRGDAEEFGWVIPFPTRPEVEKSTDELFTALQELTQPEIRVLEKKEFLAPMDGNEGKGVTVWETKKVDIYQIAVLTSDDKDALASWLEENNYQYPTSRAHILQEYIDMRWYFVAVKINTESLGELTSQQLKEGHATPLKFVFETDKPFYPLKISSAMSHFTEEIEAKQPQPVYDESVAPDREIAIAPRPPRRPNVNVLLYIFSENKAYLPGFETIYAGWVKQKTIENLGQIQGEPWIKVDKKDKYLTRLQRYFTLAEMNNDLWVRKAEDNEPVGTGEGRGIFFGKEKRLLLILGIPLALEVIIITFFLVSKGGKKNEFREGF